MGEPSGATTVGFGEPSTIRVTFANEVCIVNDDEELIDGDRTEYLGIMIAFFDNQGITDSIVVLSGISWMTEFFQHHGYHMHLLTNAQYAMYAHLEAPFIDLALPLIWSFTFFNTMVLVIIYRGYRLGRVLSHRSLSTSRPSRA